MGAPLNLSGMRFGRLVVESQAPNRIMPNGDSRRAWVCRCDCGNTTVATTLDLRKGDTKSCGCFKTDSTRDRMTKHGEHGTHLYNVWTAMRRRCYDQGHQDYRYYGGKGVRVCDEWLDDFISFKNWAETNGYAKDLTIDRIDVNQNYCPENCRWVSMKVQANNRTNSRYITFNNETHTVQEWSDLLGIPYQRLYMRLRNGWSLDRALS